MLESLTRLITKGCLRRRAPMITEAIDSLIRDGQTHLPAATVKDYMRDRMVECLANITRSRMRMMRCCSGLAILTLMLCRWGYAGSRI